MGAVARRIARLWAWNQDTWESLGADAHAMRRTLLGNDGTPSEMCQ